MTTKSFTPLVSTLTAAMLSITLYWYCSAQEPSAITLASRAAPSVKPSDTPRPAATLGHSAFMSPHASPIATQGNRVFVVNTPADTVDVIDTTRRTVIARIPVGIDPVGLAIRPDGKELWVANHISDSVSIIDIDSKSLTQLSVIATLQDFAPNTRATRFDEPVGIAFASNEKAYVALSSENAIAVVNVSTRRITKRLDITAQDPRAIRVQGDRLYVIPFESNNKTQHARKYALAGDKYCTPAQERGSRLKIPQNLKNP